GVAAVELNLSCPNVHGGAVPFASDPKATRDVVRAVKDATGLPVIVKLSPNVDHLRTAEAAEAAGADGFSLINTLVGAKIDTRTGRPVLAYGTGGLSGPAVLPVAVRMVMQLARFTSRPILGMGGVASADDALQLAMAGARLVAVGTATFTDPMAPLTVARDLRERLTREGRLWTDLVGWALRG
ncbi:MAG TPA: dihydroorotate dehydrogenase catalytic subunit, partial [Deinococcales bacterium]|nr:dihydroorotate dehydrogenase catalytic subunit [Deinococcales bacterium]